MSTIEELRKQIEQTDAYIIEKLAQRQELSKQIGALKAKEGKKIIDRLREKNCLNIMTIYPGNITCSRIS
ncbi:chorismate mutase [Legionella pneumophila]|nr:chorismate mutase [Legionella pneumophila]